MEGLMGAEDVVAQQESPLNVRWARWKQRAAPVLSFGAWPWRRSTELVQKLTSETTRMPHLMLHLHKPNGQSCADRHIESMRRARDWVVGTPHRILAQSAATCVRWSEYDAGTPIGLAIRWQNARYTHDTACLHRAAYAQRHLSTRIRAGRPHDRWEKACVKTWGASRYEVQAKCPMHAVSALI